MMTFVLTFVVLVLAILGLALGAMLGRGPIKGTCAGLACVKGSGCAGCRVKRAEERS